MSGEVFTIRRKVFSFLGAKFHIYNAAGDVIGFCKQKAFKLKEDIRIYTDDTAREERLTIKARQIIDFSAAYDVEDSATGQKVGGLKRAGFKSMLRDQWMVMDANDRTIGTILEDSMLMSLLRRFATNIIPQKFLLRSDDGQELATFRGHFNPFVQRMTVTVLPGSSVNPILVLASGVLLMAVEGRQNQA